MKLCAYIFIPQNLFPSWWESHIQDIYNFYYHFKRPSANKNIVFYLTSTSFPEYLVFLIQPLAE